MLPYYNFLGQFYNNLFPNLFGINLNNIGSENLNINNNQNLRVNQSPVDLGVPKQSMSFNFKNIRDNLNESFSFEKEKLV